ncbi:MAG TPA: hypothetical protein ENJ08_09055 [Gammaproteobacteria bacterium]|nr:hypothetical protein [Gammaproteobacteria bacterium]
MIILKKLRLEYTLILQSTHAPQQHNAGTTLITQDKKHLTVLTLVLDQGSHASRMAIFSSQGELLQLTSIEVATEQPQPDHFEQDANELIQSLQALLQQLDPKLIPRIQSCGLCTQRSTVVAWHRQTGKALSPAISWRDLRAQPLINRLETHAADCQHITGLPLSAHYSAGKIHWLLQNSPEVKQASNEQQLCIAPLSSFLLFHLLEERPFVIDHSNAQRSQLFDTQSLDWSEKMLSLFNINRQLLPQCRPMIHHYGQLKKSGIPLTAVCGDQNAIIHAYPEFDNNNTLVNIGTGAFVLSRHPEKTDTEKTRLLRSIVHSRDKHARFVTEGTVNGAGSALDLALESDPCNDIFTQLPEWLTEVTDPPIYINTVSGLGSPWWCSGGNAHYINGNTSGQSSRYVAIIESIVFLIFKNLQQLESPAHNQDSEILFISGGLSRLDGLCQKLSDLSQLRIMRFVDAEASARGCALLARQLTKNSDSSWAPLDVSHIFEPANNIQLCNRYHQFVGELHKRCNRH